MKEEIKSVKKDIFFLCFTCLCLCVGLATLFLHNQKQENRLNEHKRLLIAQQEQINQLIINAQYNKIRYEKKVR